MRELSFTRMSMPRGHCPWEGVVLVLVEVVAAAAAGGGGWGGGGTYELLTRHSTGSFPFLRNTNRSTSLLVKRCRPLPLFFLRGS